MAFLEKKGVGGSDVAAALGLSPYKTAQELFYDKIGVKLRVAEEDKSITFEIGHLLEDVVARIFQRKLVSQYIRTRQCISIPCSHLCLLT